VKRAGGATVDGREVLPDADLARMRAERHAKLQHQLAAQELDGLLLLGSSAVAYATGAGSPGCDSGRAALVRAVAAVVAGADHPHLFTPWPEGAPPELPDGHLHPAAVVDQDDGAAALVATLGELFGAGARLGCDEVPHPLARALDRLGARLVPASGVLGPAKLCKTVDELACIRRAQQVNEQAMLDVQPLLARPGVTQTDLSAVFLRRVIELGADQNAIDPIWQVMPASRGDGPWTVHGDLAFPTPSAPRPLVPGEVVWVDTGVHVGGYASDFGRTWIVGDDARPTARQQAQFARWRAVVEAVLAVCRPGVSALDLGRAAIAADAAASGGRRPWIEHFYLAHGVGTDSAEMPMVGTDLGHAFDEKLVMAPGMVLVLEPVIWDDGAAGYRSEDIVAVTDDGWTPLSDHPYDPFEAA
jgi:Xaa-Pro aminopeptidase